jgi:uncharacterized radical SAM superfamily Fe-S cluster-containing enzyme
MDGVIGRKDFYPVPCVSPITRFVEALTGKAHYDLSIHYACGMASYIFKDGEKLIPITKFVDIEGLFEYLKEKTDQLDRGKSRVLVSFDMLLKLRSFIDDKNKPKGLNLPRILYHAFLKHDYRALGVFHHKTIFIGLMHFQDLYNYDIQRVQRCAIHYALPDGRIVPFCAFNVIPNKYRDETHKKYGIPIPEWEKKNHRKLSDDFYHRNNINSNN